MSKRHSIGGKGGGPGPGSTRSSVGSCSTGRGISSSSLKPHVKTNKSYMHGSNNTNYNSNYETHPKEKNTQVPDQTIKTKTSSPNQGNSKRRNSDTNFTPTAKHSKNSDSKIMFSVTISSDISIDEEATATNIEIDKNAFQDHENTYSTPVKQHKKSLDTERLNTVILQNKSFKLPTIRLKIQNFATEKYRNYATLGREIQRCKNTENIDLKIKFAYLDARNSIVVIATDDQETHRH